MKYINEEMKNDSRKKDGDEVMKVKEDNKMNNVNPNDSNDNINSIPMMQVKVNDDEMNTTVTTTTTPIKILKDNETRHVAMTPVVLKIGEMARGSYFYQFGRNDGMKMHLGVE